MAKSDTMFRSDMSVLTSPDSVQKASSKSNVLQSKQVL